MGGELRINGLVVVILLPEVHKHENSGVYVLRGCRIPTLIPS
jgi:hypothetical protein